MSECVSPFLSTYLELLTKRAVHDQYRLFGCIRTMANEQNLVSLATRSQRERTEIAKKGQPASVKARKENKLIKDRILERMQAKDWDEYIDGIIARAKESKADAEFLRDTIGERPSDKVELSVNDDSAKEMNEYFARHSKTID